MRLPPPRVRDIKGDMITLGRHSGGLGDPAPADYPRLVRKNSLSRLPHSAARTPAVTATWWLSRASSSSRKRLSTAHEARDSSVHQRPAAHRAGLDRAVERHVGKAVVAERARGGPQRDDLGVRGGVSLSDRRIVAARNHAAVEHDKRPDRYLAAGRRAIRLFEGQPHESVVGGGLILGHGRRDGVPPDGRARSYWLFRLRRRRGGPRPALVVHHNRSVVGSGVGVRSNES